MLEIIERSLSRSPSLLALWPPYLSFLLLDPLWPSISPPSRARRFLNPALTHTRSHESFVRSTVLVVIYENFIIVYH